MKVGILGNKAIAEYIKAIEINPQDAQADKLRADSYKHSNPIAFCQHKQSPNNRI